MLIQIDENHIISTNQIVEVIRMGDFTRYETATSYRDVFDKDKALWNRFVAACVKEGDAEPLD